MLAPAWGWIVAANVLLGINQGLCWSATVIMKIDLVGPKQRGLAMGLNESAGYLAVSAAALLSGYLAAAYGLRPAPFIPGVAFAALGLLLSLLWARESRPYSRLEAQRRPGPAAATGGAPDARPFAEILLLTSWRNKTLFAASQAGMVNNLNDGMIWGLLPLLLAGRGLPLEQIAVLAAVYPAVWGLGQLVTGAVSDRLGRKPLIAAGMLVQAAGIGLLAAGRAFTAWLAGVVLLGLGTAMVYPTLLAAVSDVAHPEWRASAVGVYRLWRDGGYAVGALTAGLLADTLGLSAAVAAIGALTFLSGLIVGAVMRETLPARSLAAH
jgi:MFS family permease